MTMVTTQPTKPNHTGIRVLIFLGYLAAAGAILYGFFGMEWAPGRGSLSIGADYTERIAQEFRGILSGATGETELIAIAQAVIEEGDTLIREIVDDYWPAAAMYFVVLLGVQYAVNAFLALAIALAERQVYPVGCFGQMLMVLTIPFRVIFGLIVPIAIMINFETQFLAPNSGDGFYVTLIGVVVGGVTSLMMELIRLFIPQTQQGPNIFVTTTSNRATQHQAATATLDIFADQNAPVFDDAPEFEEGKYNSSAIFPDGDIDDPPRRRRRR
jgi:hypothetical protein